MVIFIIEEYKLTEEEIKQIQIQFKDIPNQVENMLKDAKLFYKAKLLI